MEKQIYSAPKLEQVKMEAEMPVMQTSGVGSSSNVAGVTKSTGTW